MAECKNCKNSVTDDAFFCGGCAAPLKPHAACPIPEQPLIALQLPFNMHKIMQSPFCASSEYLAEFMTEHFGRVEKWRMDWYPFICASCLSAIATDDSLACPRCKQVNWKKRTPFAAEKFELVFELYEKAKAMLESGATSSELSNAFFSPDGELTKLWNTDEERKALIKSILFKWLQDQVHILMEQEAKNFEASLE